MPMRCQKAGRAAETKAIIRDRRGAASVVPRKREQGFPHRRHGRHRIEQDRAAEADCDQRCDRERHVPAGGENQTGNRGKCEHDKLGAVGCIGER